MDVGKTKEDFKCQPVFVDKWEEVEVKTGQSTKTVMEDHHVGEDEMEEKTEEKYF